MNKSKIIRGGSWFYNPRLCRSANRSGLIPGGRDYGIGFRVVCVLKSGNKMDKYYEDLGNGINLEMQIIPSGTFLMGSLDSEQERYPDEGPQHSVTVPTFAMGRFEVTQAQYEAVVGNNPSYFKGDNRPVETVSWHDAVAFCQKLCQKTGKAYRLPSEAEWEYACRAGTTTPYYFGVSLEKTQANYDSGSTTDVGSFPPNDFGLYDMHGNVWEWCADDWHETYDGAPTDGSAWVAGGKSSQRLIFRGGSWVNNPGFCRSAFRYFINPDDRNNNFGFRVSCDPVSRRNH